MDRIRKVGILIWLLAVAAVVAMAAAGLSPHARATNALPQPEGKVILQVDGNITHANRGEAAVFDRAMLEGLGLATLRTTTAWTEGVVTFEGVRARDLLAAVGARGEAVWAEALNGYGVDIPISDFARYDVLLALKMNGTYMRVRDKGPIWIVYPRDAHSELSTVQTNARWVWQLYRLRVK